MDEQMLTRPCHACKEPGLVFRPSDITAGVTTMDCTACGAPNFILRSIRTVSCSFGPEGSQCRPADWNWSPGYPAPARSQVA